MPQIKEYLSRSNVQGPIANPGRKADPANMNIGSGLRALGSGVEDFSTAVYKRREQEETLDAASQIAEQNAQLNNEWRDRLRTADPNDKELSSRFMQDFDDRMERAGEKYTTRGARQYFEKNMANIRSGFLETTVAGQSELAAVQAKVNYRTIENSWASSVRDDPSQIDVALSAHSDAVDALVTQGLPTKAALELKAEGRQTIAKNAIMGWINVDPVGTRKRLQSGEWDSYLPDASKEVLYRVVEQEIHAREINQKQLLVDQERARSERQAVVQDQMLQQLSEGKLTPQAILNSDLDAIGPGSKAYFLDRLKRELDAPIKSNRGVRNSLLQRINLPDSDPNKIASEKELMGYASQLSNSDIRFLRSEIRKSGTEEGKREIALKSQVMKLANDRLTKGVGIKDPRGQEQLLLFQQTYYEEFDSGRKAGKSVSELTSPDFVNSILQRFERSPQEKIQDRINAYNRARNSPEADQKRRKPGESQADYLKRMGL